MDAIAGAARTYALGGFTTVIDGIVRSWRLDRFQRQTRSARNGAPADRSVPIITRLNTNSTGLMAAQQENLSHAIER